MIEVLGANCAECCMRWAICPRTAQKNRKERGRRHDLLPTLSWMLLEEPAAFDVEGYVVERIAGGESGTAIFEEGETDEVVA
jgi:hypothetical protein